MDEIRFTPRELDIMGVLWRDGPSTVAEVRDALQDDLAHNTVLTMLKVMEGKGYVSRSREDAPRRCTECGRVVETATTWRVENDTAARPPWTGSRSCLARVRRGGIARSGVGCRGGSRVRRGCGSRSRRIWIVQTLQQTGAGDPERGGDFSQ